MITQTNYKPCQLVDGPKGPQHRCKPFNLEEAKAGKAVVTRLGQPARIICFDAKRATYPIITLVDEENDGVENVNIYTLDGRLYDDEVDDLDLFMAPEEVDVWTAYYKDKVSGKVISFSYETKDEAETHKQSLQLMAPNCEFIELRMVRLKV